METNQLIRISTALSLLLSCFVKVDAQTLFRDQMLSGAGWGVNANNADSQATFGYDYSSDDIPEAPNGQSGDAATRGVKLEANLVSGTSSVFTIFPMFENFEGNYRLRFDAWMNYDADERINGGSIGTNEFLGGRIGYDDVLDDTGIGTQVLATGDGGSSSDWRVFADATFLDSEDMVAGSRNGSDSHYSDFLPGVEPPAGQAQVTFPEGTAGSPGFQWVTFEINTINGISSIIIEKPNGERLPIVVFNQSDFGSSSNGNIGIMYADYFTSVSPRPDLTFGIVDNVEVAVIAPPAALPPAAPNLKLKGKSKRKVTKAKIRLKGTASDSDGSVARVEIKAPGKPFRRISGTTKWRKNIRLKEGRNVIRIRAIDDTGLGSKVERVIVIRS